MSAIAKNYHTVEIGFGDINGALIGKRTPARFFEEHLGESTGICRAPLTWDIQNDYFSERPFAGFAGGAPDMMLLPDIATLREIPWRPGTAFVLADIVYEDGTPIEVSPRQILKNILKRFSALGYAVKVGSEIEFYLLDEYKRPLFGGKECYSIGRIGWHSDIYDEIQKNLEALGIRVEGIHTEYGPGQSEVILEYEGALEGADNMVIAKNAIKEIARKKGLYATFMALPWAEHSASGYHLHQSLWTEGGANAFAALGADAATALPGPSLLDRYLAGLLATTQAFAALSSPSVNSYKRLAEMSFAPTRVGAGYDNRTVSARLFGQGSGLRIEQRTGSSDANPYLLIAASAAGGLYGLENALPPPALVTGNHYFDETLGEIPRTLAEAAALFGESPLAAHYFGKEFVEIYGDYLQHDIAAHHAAVTDWERERYMENA
ncbi:MAG: glutamine synthetase family protein [Clostridiales Family XIII bacterium]|jgi:glutamine synthetase|nr:glutamine synthetase family protein [Clostridiales Family XIII bacterium]